MPTVAPFLRVYIPALATSLITVLMLRPIGLPRGLKVGVAFFVFLMVQAVSLDRASGEMRSRAAWLATVILAALCCGVMWLIDP